jgi:hypothetical protein
MEPDKNKVGIINCLCFLKFNVTAKTEFNIANTIINDSVIGCFMNERNATKGIVAKRIGRSKQ